MLNMRDDHSLLLYYDLMNYSNYLNRMTEEKVIIATLKSDNDEVRHAKFTNGLTFNYQARRYLDYITPTGMML